MMCGYTEGVDDTASSGDLASILHEVHRLRVQLEHCISSNDRLRHTLRKCGVVVALHDDGSVVSTKPDGGKLL